jgi:hypothetical protein
MKYANKEKTAVITNDKAGNQWIVPRGHRFWSEFEIDKAEQQGVIDEAEPITTDSSHSGG